MSRVAKNPIDIPAGVEVKIQGSSLLVKGSKGQLSHQLNPVVNLEINDKVIYIKWNDADKFAVSLAGTTRAVVNNMVTGVTSGYEKKLTLIGVGYRSQVKGKHLVLTLGYSHPIEYEIPEGISIETPSQTEIIVKGSDKQKVGQVAAEIREFRIPEPYKGKGVRYTDEYVARKEAKKK